MSRRVTLLAAISARAINARAENGRADNARAERTGDACRIPVVLALCLAISGLIALTQQARADSGSGEAEPGADLEGTLRPAPPPEPETVSAPSEHRLLLIVRGASGTAEYGRLFDRWAGNWRAAAEEGGVRVERIGPTGSAGSDSPAATASSPPSDFDLLRHTLTGVTSGSASEDDAEHDDAEHDAISHDDKEPDEADSPSEVWIVLLGHGTFDGRTARFNLRGRDVSAKELAEWLDPIESRVAVINCSSASGPFLKALAAPDRVVVTATKSGAEVNFARFGRYISEAIGDPAFDLDKDGQTSLFEAFLAGSRRTQQFYESEGRLATEHALLDDNGDGLGVRADFFRGVRQVREVQSGAAVDSRLAHRFHLVRSDAEQRLTPEARRKRDELEQAVFRLRERKDSFEDEDTYYAELEPLLIQLARLLVR